MSETETALVWSGGEGELAGVVSGFVGEDSVARERFVEFFVARLSNRRTRLAYGTAVAQFARWCAEHGLTAAKVSTVQLAAYIESLKERVSTPTVRLHLSALRGLYSHLATTGVVIVNPATSVRAPRYSVTGGKTPVLTDEQVRSLLESIPTTNMAGLRDRALLAVMVYSAARVGAVCRIRVGDYFGDDGKMSLRLAEKGGRARPAVPVHSRAVPYLEAYLDAAGIRDQVGSPFFRRMANWGNEAVSRVALTENAVLKVVKRRARAVGLPASISCHSFRATSITSLRRHGGDLEAARQLAGHADVATTRLYDRSDNELLREDVERIGV